MSKVLKTAAVVVGAVALIATGVGAVAVAGSAIAAVAATVATVASIASGVLSLAAAVSAPKPKAGDATGSQTSFSANPDAGIPLVIGRTGTAGNITFRRGFDTNDAGDNDRQAFISTLSLGPVAQIEGMTVDKVPTFFGGTGAAIGAFAGFMWSMTQLGAVPEAQALGFGAGAGNPPGWSSESRMSGLAAASWMLRFDTKAKVFTNGVPAPMWTVKGVLAYDPRKDSTYPGGSGPHRMADPADTAAYDAAVATWEWSEDPYIIGLRWAHGFWHRDPRVSGSTYQRVMGIGAPQSGIDVAAFVEGANIAKANGWTVGGVIFSGDEKWSTMKRILQAGMGEPLALGARISCLVNAPKVSLATITVDDVIGEASVSATQPRRDRFNTVTPRYRLEANNWDLLPGTPISVAEHVAEDRGRRTKVIDYPFIQNTPQVATAARYDIENAREFGPIVLPLKLVWMGYKPGDCVTANLPELGLNGQPILLLNRELDPSAGVTTMTARSETAAKHPYALGQTTTPPSTPGVSGSLVIPVPADGAWAITGTSVAANGVTMPALVITGAIDAATAEGIVFEYRPFQNGQAADAGWISAGVEPPTARAKTISGVQSQTAYEVAISYQRYGVVGNRRIIGPVSTAAYAGLQGEAAPLVMVQWSVDGMTGWHADYADGDKFQRQSNDNGATWGPAVRVVGESASSGVDGVSPSIVFKRSATVPPAPDQGTGNPPTGWSDDPPAGDDFLWQSVSKFRGAAQLEPWSTPVRITGPAGKDGVSAYTAILSNETHTVPADAAGNVLSYAGADFILQVFYGGSDVTGSFHLDSSDNPQQLAGTSEHPHYSIYGGFDPSEDVATVTYRFKGNDGTPHAGVLLTKVFSLSKSKGGADGSSPPLISLSASAQTVRYTPAGVPVGGQSITFTARRQNSAARSAFTLRNVDGTVIAGPADAATFAQNAGTAYWTAVDADTLTLNGAGIARVMADHGGAAGRFTMLASLEGSPMADIVSVQKIQDGAKGDPGLDGTSPYSATLSNEAHTVPADYAGNVTSYAGASFAVQIFYGVTDVTGSFHLDSVDNPQNIYGPSSYPTYSINGGFDASEDTASITYRFKGNDGTAHAGVTIAKTFSLAKSKGGLDGSSPPLISLSASSQTARYDTTGVLVPGQAITFGAKRQNTGARALFTLRNASGTAVLGPTDAASFASAGGTQYWSAVDVDTITLTEAGITRILADHGGAAGRITMVASIEGTGVVDSVSVQKVQDGAKGDRGIAGPGGYVHTAYANSADGTVDFHVSDATGRAYLGTYTDQIEADSTNPALYSWQLVKGAPGQNADDLGLGMLASGSGSVDLGSSSSGAVTLVNTSISLQAGRSLRLTLGGTNASRNTGSNIVVATITVSLGNQQLFSGSASIAADGTLNASTLSAASAQVVANNTGGGAQQLVISYTRGGPVGNSGSFNLSYTLERL